MKMIKDFNLYKCFSTKTILVTGHTGFKGSWLSLVLSLFGAKVIGVSLKDNYKNSMINIFGSSKIIHKQYFFNICDNKRIQKVILLHKPSFVFHLAAQAVVKTSFDDPIKTWNTNLIGTINILNNFRLLKKIVAVIVTSDKCYKNIESYKGYKEEDVLFGSDPYSASKSCAEIAIKSYCDSFFTDKKKYRLASARAGNVVGGGDFSENRLLPDIFRAISKKKILRIRNLKSTRPWQHVLEPIFGYLVLAYNLKINQKISHESYNFGPSKKSPYTVEDVLKYLKRFWNVKFIKQKKNKIMESELLHLNSTKAFKMLKWKTYLSFEDTLSYTVDWYNQFRDNKKNIYNFSRFQIFTYLKNYNLNSK
jgi:CDP-glucose 4,6-dehydratase